MAQGPTVRRLQLGRELRRYREAAQTTREAAAGRLSRDYTWLSRAEGGKLTPSVAEVEMLLNFYGVASESEECQRILEIAREARKRSSTKVPELLRAYLTFEAEAVEIRQFAVDLVPGLLQTEDYARAVFEAVDPARDPAEIERLVTFRTQRQARLIEAQPLHLWIVIDEAALRRLVGGPDVMRGQLDRLLTLTKLPNVSIRMVPNSVGAHAAMGAPFSVLNVEEPDNQAVCVESLWSVEVLDQAAQVQMYLNAFDRLSGAAQSERSTAKIIKEARGELQ